MKEEELKRIWKKYIDKKVYRIVPTDQKSSILNYGFDPNKDPYEKFNNKIKKMFNIVLKLEKKGIVFEDKWKNGPVKGSAIVKISMRSVKGKYIDFVLNKEQIKTFKRNWDGGCLVTYVFKLSGFLKENSDKLNSEEKRLVNYLNKWASNKRGRKSVVLYIKGSNKIFESARFYYFNEEFKRYWASPFGSFEHFIKIIKKQGIEKYLPFLKKEKLVYLRVTERIPAKDIIFLK